jgi:hypothetical protein
MKRLYEWITKANQVLLFFLIIGVAILISQFVYDRFRPYEQPHVSIAQSAEEAKSNVVQDVLFLKNDAGVFVFGLMKRVIVADESSWRRTAYLGNEELAYPGGMVNVVFSKEGQPLRKLLQRDGLVLSHAIFVEYEHQKMKASLFVCVTDDTDGNHRLDKNDRNDLHVVFEDLSKPTLVVNGVSEHWVISPTHLVVKTAESTAPHFWDIDLETQAKKEIAWK